MATKYQDKLTPDQFNIAYGGDKELPFFNKYCGNKETGLYKSAASGQILFSSKDKFQTGRGRPSFYKPANPDALIEIGKPTNRTPVISTLVRGQV